MRDTAAGLAALGRGPDSMLVHMSPREVAGLQQLAMAHGGSLTTNPQTGLPEAGFLDNILPTILGVGLNFMFPGSSALIGAGVGAVQAARTGDIGQGILAGLGAFGGAGVGEALTAQGAGIAGHQAGLQAIGGPEAFTGANLAGTAAAPSAINPAFNSALTEALPDAAFNLSGSTPQLATAAAPAASAPMGQTYAEAFQAAQPTTAMGRLQAAGTGLQNITEPGFMANLGQQFPTTRSQVAAGIGALGAMGGFEQPQSRFGAPQQQPSNYRKQGPNQREYDPSAPGGYYFTDRGILQPNFLAARGGEVPSVPQLEDGGFVLTKKAVDGIGKGSNDRGQRVAAAGLGAIPIKGPGTGTSDSIPTTIDGKRPALVSNGEAYVPRDQVKRRGGAKKFYALMKKAEQASRRA